MNDTVKPPVGFDAIPVSSPAAVLEMPRPPMPTTRPAPRQTVPLPPMPEAEVPAKPLAPPRPAAIAPETSPTTPATSAPTGEGVEPNPLAGTPAPKPSVFSGLIWDLVRPNRAKVAVLAGVASLAAGAFGLNFLLPGGSTPPKDGAQVKIKIPVEEPKPIVPAPAPKPTAGVPESNVPKPPIANLTREAGREADPTQPTTPDLFPGSDPTSTATANKLPELPIQDKKLLRTSGTATGTGVGTGTGSGVVTASGTGTPTGTGPGTASGTGTGTGTLPDTLRLPPVPGGPGSSLPPIPGLPGDNLPPLPALPGSGVPSKPQEPQMLPPMLGAGASGGPMAPLFPEDRKPNTPNALEYKPSNPADNLPKLPDLPVGGTGASTPLPQPGGATTGTLPLPTGPAPIAPGAPAPVMPGGPVKPQPGSEGAGRPLPTLGELEFPTLPPVAPNDSRPVAPAAPGGNGLPPLPGERNLPPLPGTDPKSKPAELKPLEIKPQDLKALEGKPAFPGETNPFGTTPPTPGPKPMEPVIGASNVTTPGPLPGGLGVPPTALQPPVAEAKTDYDVDLHRPRPADTYASLSRVYYGGPQYAAALQSFNKGQPIERLAEVQVPPLHVIRKLAPARDPQVERFPPERPISTPSRSSSSADDGPDWGAPGTAGNGQVVYTLFTVPRKGLTLRDVAKTFYGSDRQWAKLNNSRNPKYEPDDELPVGTQLQVPTEVLPFR